MKKHLLPLLLVVLWLGAIAQVPTTGLIAYYPMGIPYSNVSPLTSHLDASGNGYHLTVSNGFGHGLGRSGVVGESAQFNASNSDMRKFNYSSAQAAFQPTGDFTISVWVKLGSPFTNEYNTICQVGDNDIFLRFRHSGGGNYFLQGGYRTGGTTFAVNNIVITGASFFNTWKLVTLRRTGSDLQLFADNTFLNGINTATPISYGTVDKDFKVGNTNSAATCFNGGMQDVFYYSRALSGVEIAQLVCATTPPLNTTTDVYQNICPGTTVTLTASSTPSSNPVKWYTTAVGGTPLLTGTILALGAVNASATYYIDATASNNCVSFARVPIAVTVNSAQAAAPVNTTPLANLSVCSGSTTTLTATGATLTWYAGPSGGASIGSGGSFTTPAITGNTTYYVQAGSGNCASARTAIAITLKVTPPTPTNTTQSASQNTCGNQSTVLSVTGTGGTINWYTVPSGGTSVGTGTSFTTPVLPNPATPGTVSTLTYYAQETNACGTSARLAIPITVKYKYSHINTTPPANMVVCTGGTTTLSVSSTAPIIEWAIFFGDGTVLSSTNTLTQQIPNDILYYVEAKGDPATTCASFEVFSVRTATATGTAPTDVTPVDSITNVCAGRSVTIRIASNNGGVLLYDAPTGGNAVASASSSTNNVQYINTPIITGTTTFYAQTGIGTCASPRIPVTVTTVPTPAGTITLANDTIRASHLYDTYVLKKDGAVVSSGNTGSFAVPATACGTYQAQFTNTVNSCNNIGVNIARTNPPCRTAFNFSNVQFPITYDYAIGSQPGAPYLTLTQNPLNVPNCTNVVINLVVKSATGCEYRISFFTGGLANGPVNTSMLSTSDSITNCTIFSNIIQIAPQGPINTTAAPFLSVCNGLSTILSASGSGTLEWYSDSTGGQVLGTGTSFNTPAITANTTYYVQSVNGGCTSTRTPVAVSVNALPPTPVNATPTANQNICSGNSTVLSVTPAGAGISTFWSLFPQGGNTFTTGASATIPASSLTATDTFYVGNAYVSNNCNSPLIPIIVNVTQAPAAPVNTTPTANQTVCTGSSTTLTATGTGTLEWFTNPTGGNALSTGGSFTTPAINTVTSYFVASNGGNGCSSTRTEVQVTTAPVPPAPNNTTTTANLSRCVGNSTTLTASTNFANAPLKWYANATGGTSLATGGSYTTPVLTATDTFYVAAESATCPSPRTAIIVTVNALPTAGISTVIPSVCPGESITLTASGGTGYAWSNSGGSNAAATFTPASATTYTVTVTNAATCTATASLNVTIRTAPVAAIAPSGAAICSGQSQALTASGGTGYAWSNSLGNGANKTVNPTQTTTYIVTVTNANACSDTASITVNVTATPVAAINGPTTICAGLSATLTASGGASYAWSNSLGNNAAITVSPTQNTIYTVTVSNDNCTATASQTVSVQSAPTATVSGNTTICNGQSTTLTANGGNTYTWSNGLGSTPTITVSPATTTTYNVTVSIGANCSATTTQTITVNQPSASAFSETLCFGESTTFAGNTLSAGGAYSDTLQNAAGCDSIITLNLTVLNKVEKTVAASICNGQSFDFNGTQLTQAGQYFDTLQTVLGCDSFIVLNLAVVNQLTSSFSAAICQGETYDFNGQQLTSADSYTTTFTSTGGCDSVVTLNLIVNALPQPIVTASANVVSTQAFDSYQWQLEGSDINGADEQQYTATENGNYSVVVSDANGCQNTSAAVSVTGVGINDVVSNIAKLYPNPAENTFTVELSGNNHTSIVSITDVNGALLLKTTIEGNKATLNVIDMPAGILNVQVTNTNGTSTTKLIKLK